jgi:hypothetical protein
MFRNETLRFTTSGDTNSLSVKVFDHKTLGKDKELGEAMVDVGVTNLSLQRMPVSLNVQLPQVRKYMQPSFTGAEEWVALNGGAGSVQLRFDFEVGPAPASRMRTPSLHSKNGALPNSPSKFSMSKKAS